MNNEELHASRGRVSSMPGSSHSLPAGTKCDQHEDREAVARIQGETDSFGCEYCMMCQECLDQHRAYRAAELEKEKRCDWCGCMSKGVRSRRDFEEGMSGRLYDVCPACIDKENKLLAEELAENDRYRGDYDDLIDDDDDYGPQEWNEGDGHGVGLHNNEALGPADEEPRHATPKGSPIISYKKRRKVLERPA
jgi:hypothetical protein